MTKAGATQPLVRLLKSGSEHVHSAAAAALEVLTMDATQRERLLAATPGYGLEVPEAHAAAAKG